MPAPSPSPGGSPPSPLCPLGPPTHAQLLPTEKDSGLRLGCQGHGCQPQDWPQARTALTTPSYPTLLRVENPHICPGLMCPLSLTALPHRPSLEGPRQDPVWTPQAFPNTTRAGLSTLTCRGLPRSGIPNIAQHPAGSELALDLSPTPTPAPWEMGTCWPRWATSPASF